jgi:hypothetical protein
MEVCDQVHSLVILDPWKQPLALNEWEAKWIPQLTSAFFRQEKSLFLAKTNAQFLGCPAH